VAPPRTSQHPIVKLVDFLVFWFLCAHGGRCLGSSCGQALSPLALDPFQEVAFGMVVPLLWCYLGSLGGHGLLVPDAIVALLWS
jgi:hypothetical protein